MSYYLVLVYCIDILFKTIQGDCFLQSYTPLKGLCGIFLVLLNSVIIMTSFFLRPASRLCGRHHHGWVRYIDTTKITALSFVWNRLFFNQYSYFRDIFFLGPVSRLCNCHRHVWVLFSIVNEIYDYYKARSAISLFQMSELFSHHFQGFKLEIFHPCNIRKPIRFLDISNKYFSIFLTST